MKNRIYDGVLINLLQTGAAPGDIHGIASRFMNSPRGDRVSLRYKEAVARFSTDDGLLAAYDPAWDPARRLFHRHYRPRIYWIFGFFDLAILQLCDSLELIPELSALPGVSATQNIFGLRTVAATADGREEVRFGSLELCSPVLPYLLICNVKVHPLVQMILGQELQGLLNAGFSAYLDEAAILRRFSEPSEESLLTLGIISTYGWNELTFLIHGCRFDGMMEFVHRSIRGLTLGNLLDGLGRPARESFAAAVGQRWQEIRAMQRSFGIGDDWGAEAWRKIHLFTYTNTIPGIDYGLSRELQRASDLSTPEGAAEFRAGIRLRLNNSIEKHTFGTGKYLEQIPTSSLEPV
ncbi:MAG: hypothetical protein KDD47_16640, partial [Acidobacteria bacterium]|nr:hypothetical protein [Acidobacteriota bacterium]